jgi:hypothetical protein
MKLNEAHKSSSLTESRISHAMGRDSENDYLRLSNNGALHTQACSKH